MSTTFLWQGGRKIAVTTDPDEITIHAEQEDEAREAALAASVPATNLRAVSPGLIRARVTDRDGSMKRLREANRVVHHVYRDEKTGQSEFLIGESFFIKFKEGTKASVVDEYLRTNKLVLEREVGPNLLLVRVTTETGMNPIRAANAAVEHKDVEYAEPNLVRTLRRMSSFIPADPYFPRQWHLDAPANSQDLVKGAGIFAPEAWSETRGSREVVVAVADDAIDLTHPDFVGEGKVVGRLNAIASGSHLYWDEAVQPRPGDYHGTPCAGVAVAEQNGQGTVGVAPGCALLAVRFPLSLSDAHMAQLFEKVSSVADVISCSWGYGPADAPMSRALSDTISRLAKEGGRRGKGLVICIAAGNNNCPIRDLENETKYFYLDGNGYKRSYDGPIDRWIAAHPDVITVSAATSLKHRSAYSSWGKEINVCAPSNNFDDLYEISVSGRGVFTTDNEGFGPGSDFTPQSRYTPEFGGTSSATPTVAGVAALVISVNPSLTAAEVRKILENTADKDLVIESATPVNVPGDFVNGFSLWFGYGKVNARAAVAAARAALATTTTVQQTMSPDLPIEDVGQPVLSIGTVAETGKVEDVRVSVSIAHTYIGDLRVELISPDGVAVPLHQNTGGAQRNLERTYGVAELPALRGLLGREASGKWTLSVRDTERFDKGKLKSWTIALKVQA
ncbi:MAG: S8 family serine peptidase [Myxococcales bacterium]|nr:S8 family serine peptidase [Myxococcales bacterium]